MKKRLYAFLLMIPLITAPWVHTGHAAAAAPVVAWGSQNGDVSDLQFRLNALGYYYQPIDGKFGARTSAALIRFQQAYGLKADGVAGTQTWSALKKYSLDQSEMDILAKVIYSEARGESYEGQVAVGAVVLNRIKSPLFPNNIRDVVFAPGAFSSVNDGQFWMTPDATAYKAAYDAVRGWDPTYGSLYYFNPNTATSSWIWSRPQVVTIGHHIFAR